MYCVVYYIVLHAARLQLHGEKDHVCDVCGKTFYQIHAMKLHYDSVHTDRLKVSCQLCNKVFRNKYSLHQHIKQFHTANISIYACEICGMCTLYYAMCL